MAENDDPIDFPDEWLGTMHPRRSGRRGWVYSLTVDARALVAEQRRIKQADFDQILDDPASDPQLVDLVRSGEISIATAGVRMVLDGAVLDSWPASVRLDEYIVALGLTVAAAACLLGATCGVGDLAKRRDQSSSLRQGRALVSAESPLWAAV